MSRHLLIAIVMLTIFTLGLLPGEASARGHRRHSCCQSGNCGGSGYSYSSEYVVRESIQSSAPLALAPERLPAPAPMPDAKSPATAPATPPVFYAAPIGAGYVSGSACCGSGQYASGESQRHRRFGHRRN